MLVTHAINNIYKLISFSINLHDNDIEQISFVV